MLNIFVRWVLFPCKFLTTAAISFRAWLETDAVGWYLALPKAPAFDDPERLHIFPLYTGVKKM